MIPLFQGVKKVIMVGDHMKLPATVFCDQATSTKYNRSLFERLLDNNYPKYVLNIQYRMQTNIREFVGNTFYDNHLKDCEKTKALLDNSPLYSAMNKKFNFSFFDLKNSKEKFLSNSKSYVNDDEVEFVVDLINSIQSLVDLCNEKYNQQGDFFNVNNSNFIFKYAVISPYKAQVKALIEKIQVKCHRILPFIEVNTVDSFQGREQEIVIISSVRSNYSEDKSSSRIGFLNDYRRMNVALSRAKLACFVVGNSNTLIHNEYWHKLIDYCLSKNSLFPIRNEYITQDKIDNIINLLRKGTLLSKYQPVALDDDIEEGEIDGTVGDKIVDNRIMKYEKDIRDTKTMNDRYKNKNMLDLRIDMGQDSNRNNHNTFLNRKKIALPLNDRKRIEVVKRKTDNKPSEIIVLNDSLISSNNTPSTGRSEPVIILNKASASSMKSSNLHYILGDNSNNSNHK